MARFNPSSALRLRLILFLIPCLFSFCRPFDRLTAQTGAIVHPVTALGVPCSQSSCAVMHFWAGGIGPKLCSIAAGFLGFYEDLDEEWIPLFLETAQRSLRIQARKYKRARMCAVREKLFFLFFCCVICNVNSYVCYCLTPPAAYFRTASAQQFPHNSINGLKIGLPRLSLLQH